MSVDEVFDKITLDLDVEMIEVIKIEKESDGVKITFKNPENVPASLFAKVSTFAKKYGGKFSGTVKTGCFKISTEPTEPKAAVPEETETKNENRKPIDIPSPSPITEYINSVCKKCEDYGQNCAPHKNFERLKLCLEIRKYLHQPRRQPKEVFDDSKINWINGKTASQKDCLKAFVADNMDNKTFDELFSKIKEKQKQNQKPIINGVLYFIGDPKGEDTYIGKMPPFKR